MPDENDEGLASHGQEKPTDEQRAEQEQARHAQVEADRGQAPMETPDGEQVPRHVPQSENPVDHEVDHERTAHPADDPQQQPNDHQPGVDYVKTEAADPMPGLPALDSEHGVSKDPHPTTEPEKFAGEQGQHVPNETMDLNDTFREEPEQDSPSPEPVGWTEDGALKLRDSHGNVGTWFHEELLRLKAFMGLWGPRNEPRQEQLKTADVKDWRAANPDAGVNTGRGPGPRGPAEELPENQPDAPRMPRRGETEKNEDGSETLYA